MIVKVDKADGSDYIRIDDTPNDNIARTAAYRYVHGEKSKLDQVGNTTEILDTQCVIVVFVTDDGYVLRRVGEFLWGDGDHTFGMDKDGWPTDFVDGRLSGYFTCRKI